VCVIASLRSAGPPSSLFRHARPRSTSTRSGTDNARQGRNYATTAAFRSRFLKPGVRRRVASLAHFITQRPTAVATGRAPSPRASARTRTATTRRRTVARLIPIMIHCIAEGATPLSASFPKRRRTAPPATARSARACRGSAIVTRSRPTDARPTSRPIPCIARNAAFRARAARRARAATACSSGAAIRLFQAPAKLRMPARTSRVIDEESAGRRTVTGREGRCRSLPFTMIATR
jgi:hypothetical protein